MKNQLLRLINSIITAKMKKEKGKIPYSWGKNTIFRVIFWNCNTLNVVVISS